MKNKDRQPPTLTEVFRNGAEIENGISGRRPMYNDQQFSDDRHRIERASQPDHEHEWDQFVKRVESEPM